VAAALSLNGINGDFRAIPLRFCLDTVRCGRDTPPRETLINSNLRPSLAAMQSENTTRTVPVDHAAPEPNPQLSIFSSLVQTAELEFQVSLRLLAERARCVAQATGAAIALGEGGQPIYWACTGDSAPEVGTPVNLSQEIFRQCIVGKRSVQSPRALAEGGTEQSLLVPVIKNEKAVGFFELVNQAGFGTQELDALTRLADLVTFALDRREAAEQAESRMAQNPPRPATSALWHAPELTLSDSSQVEHCTVSSASAPANIQTCKSCGFPVSPGRALCLDCEKGPAVSTPELFAASTQESWIKAHGYTVACLLMTALAAAIILWLRR
jgi:hypothetical protein